MVKIMNHKRLGLIFLSGNEMCKMYCNIEKRPAKLNGMAKPIICYNAT
jgi:hypothetical protein